MGGWSEAALGASVCGPWPLLGPLLAVLCCSCGLGGSSRVALRASVGGPGSLKASVGSPGSLSSPLWVVLDGSQGLCGWSWMALRASVGGPGRSQGLCGWSWVVLRASVGGPGSLSGPRWAVLGPDQVGKWPKPQRGQERRARSEPPEGPDRSEAQFQFFQEILSLTREPENLN